MKWIKSLKMGKDGEKIGKNDKNCEKIVKKS